MYKTNRELLNRIVAVVFAISFIAIMNPYFLWSGYRGGIFSASGIPVLKLIYVLTIIAGIIFVANNSKISGDRFKLFVFLFIDMFVLVFVCGGRLLYLSDINLSTFLNFLIVGLFCLLPDYMKKMIYQYCLLFFVISIIPGIIYSILTFFGVNLSMETITASSVIKQNNYVTYLHWPFAVQISKTYDLFGNLNRFRLCGIYDEPGRVGTISALFLAAEKYEFKKKWKNIVLLIGGILTLSLAFFLMIGIGEIIKLFKEKKTKQALIILLAIFAFFVFLKIDFTNVAISSFQQRFAITTSGLAGYNRTDSLFDSIFSSYLKDSDIFSLLFGNGDGTIYKLVTEAGIGTASSYKCLIYDFGFLGTLLYLLWIIFYSYIYLLKNKSFSTFIMINVLMILCTIYQRPNMFNPSYIIIPLCAISMYTIKENETELPDSNYVY